MICGTAIYIELNQFLRWRSPSFLYSQSNGNGKANECWPLTIFNLIKIQINSVNQLWVLDPDLLPLFINANTLTAEYFNFIKLQLMKFSVHLSQAIKHKGLTLAKKTMKLKVDFDNLFRSVRWLCRPFLHRKIDFFPRSGDVKPGMSGSFQTV